MISEMPSRMRANRLLAARPVRAMLVRGTGALATDAGLPDYPARV
ncbi:hypothetical protein [Micromonospora sp. NPDC093277]